MPTRYLEYIKPKSQFGRWAWGPIIMLRIVLFGTYLGFTFAAIIALIAGVPILDFSTLPGWLSMWAFVLGTSAAVSAVGSLTDRWQKIELWSTMVMSAMLLAYVGGLNLAAWVEHDLDRQFVGVVAAIASFLPLGRFVYLAAQSGKIHVEPKRSK